jgi:hypothetical protein
MSFERFTVIFVQASIVHVSITARLCLYVVDFSNIVKNSHIEELAQNDETEVVRQVNVSLAV